MAYIRNKLIKMLGGYTEKEKIRWENKYQALLDSKTTDKSPQIVNEYIYRMLKILDGYARKDLYGQELDMWTSKMFNVIHNNMMRILIRYLHCGSSIIYKVDTTLETKDEFLSIIAKDTNKRVCDLDFDDIDFILETD